MSQRKRRNASALLLLAALLCADGLAENEAVAAAGGDTRSPETAAALLAAMTAARASVAKGDDGSQIHADDTRVMAEVTQALDRKQALIAELRAMQQEVGELQSKL